MIAIYILLGIIIVVCAWLFLIAPGYNKKMDYYKSKKYAHRGLHGTVGAEEFAAENSITAFKRAIDHGYGIELDVRLSKDGEVIVFHDGTLDRVTNGKGKVSDFTLEELKKLYLNNTSDTIPALKEVLEVVDGKVPLLVEIKEEGTDHTLSQKCADILKGYTGEYLVESFSPLAFGAFKKELPEIPRGFLAYKHTRNANHRNMTYRVIQRFLLNFIARPAFIAIDHKDHKLFPMPVVKALFGTPMIAWTICTKEEEDAAYKNGFSGIIFEGYLPKL